MRIPGSFVLLAAAAAVSPSCASTNQAQRADLDLLHSASNWQNAPSQPAATRSVSAAVPSWSSSAPSSTEAPRSTWPAGSALSLAGFLQEESSDAPKEEEVVNDGQDPLNPIKRVDFRFRTGQDAHGLARNVMTLRTDQIFPIKNGKLGSYYARIDLPGQGANTPSPNDNSDGDWEWGFGDTLIQQIWINDFAWSRALGANGGGLGLRTVLPTATKDIFGSGQYVLAPLVGAKWALPSISPGSGFTGALFWFNNVGSHEDGRFRDDTNELGFQPIFNISTTSWDWPIDFLTFYSSESIRFNFEDGKYTGKESGDVRIPMDIAVGKLLDNNSVVVSAQGVYDFYNSDDFSATDWYMEFRIGFFF